MRNFRRALKDALKQWPSIFAATGCSLVIALLWSGNIAAFYPILQVVLEDKSIQKWVDEQVENNENFAKEQDATLLSLKQTFDAGELDQREFALQSQARQRDKSNAESSVKYYTKLQPFVNKWVPKTPFQTIVAIVCILMVTTVIKHVFMIINELLVAKVAIDVTRSLRSKLFSTALYMDRGSYSNFGLAGFSAHITHTSEGLTSGLVNTLGAAIREPLKIVACIAGAAFINWRLLLISIFIAPFIGVLLVSITKRLKAVSRSILGQATMFHEVMYESLNNLQTVQAYCMEKNETDRFDASIKLMRTFGLKLTFFTALTKPVIEFLGLGMLCTTIVAGSYLVLQQKTAIFGIPVAREPMTVQALLTFFGMLIGMSDPLRRLSSIYSSIYTGSIAADGIYSILDQKNKIADAVEVKQVTAPHKTLQISNVTFGYRADQTILHSVDLTVPFGSTTAIVGANGSGKSTLINLLCRFYDPDAGNITLDGVDLRDMKVRDLRNRIALVTQTTELFNNDIMYNIMYGAPGATPEKAIEAARAAHAHEFIELLPEGYQTMVGQGGHRLSGGQRQRVSLARALLRNPEILILDECTSQIDMHSEVLIRQSLREHRGHRTMIIITHREALLELADATYEVVKGKFERIENPEWDLKAA